ncbi:MAG TPA: RsmB/NOP family class I SAM-dependent RNA methyltransferase [Candidatus Hydrothermia bacterium]|nr:RsmB/NOP family class I SAM-dependent RNA methyltransferase [Candidatus Hydrothermia bacterium]HOP31959.1 RsmB/NOP family class I SAM-dependent RNA methyltransferase [Candidatus Hydrothermia bacterium]HRD22383.1 RsmB/NOP family class I SAM-dependent RNA methyltransferase [Candidatus Hydrothermia bacterium]
MDERLIKNNVELMRFLDKFYGDKLSRFLESTGKKLKTAIRINSLKIDREHLLERLKGKGFKLTPIPFYDDGFVLDNAPMEVGSTVEHFMGYYYVQGLSSMIPPLLLNPAPGEMVLDIASAPGSKTTQMAQMMKNRGTIVANDIDVERIKALSNNIDRMGVLNTIIIHEQGCRFGQLFPDAFDKVLVDAPCSALGTLNKNTEVVKWWSREKIGKLMSAQKGIILSGFDALRPGGVMVYSTCTVTPEENEYIVNYLLKERLNAEVLDFSLPGITFRDALVTWERFEFAPQIAKCKRIEPHLNPDFEGFFIALIRKLSS